MSSAQTQIQADTLKRLEEIRDQLGYSDRNLRKLIALLSPPTVHYIRRITLANSAQWYPWLCPQNMRFWILHILPVTAKLSIGYGRTANLAEAPPIQEYTTIDAAVANGVQRIRMDSSPELVWFNSDTASTTVEIEAWLQGGK